MPVHLRNQPSWKSRPVEVIKYIDDALTLEKVDVYREPLLETPEGRKKVVDATRSGAMFGRIAARAKLRGMKVNEEKTNVLCVTDSIAFRPEVQLQVGDATVTSGETLKVLGFTFTRNPTVNAHVKLLIKKLRSRTWALSKLRRAGFISQARQ